MLRLGLRCSDVLYPYTIRHTAVQGLTSSSSEMASYTRCSSRFFCTANPQTLSCYLLVWVHHAAKGTLSSKGVGLGIHSDVSLVIEKELPIVDCQSSIFSCGSHVASTYNSLGDVRPRVSRILPGLSFAPWIPLVPCSLF